MARELSNQHCRIQLTGPDDVAPTDCKYEYRVENGDLTEVPSIHTEGTPDFNQSVDALGAALASTVKAAESIV